MNNWKRLTICAVVILALAVSGYTAQRDKPSSADEMLERQLPGSDGEDLTATDAFFISLGRIGASGGAAHVRGCGEDSLKQVWTPLNKSLRQGLDAIVKADPRYRWEVIDEVINLLPVSGEPALLQTRINEFHVENMTSAIDALGPLLALPEVKKAMDALRLKPGIALFISSRSPKPFSVKCEGVTLRQALNAIARAQGRATWDYVELHCNGRDEVIIRF